MANAINYRSYSGQDARCIYYSPDLCPRFIECSGLPDDVLRLNCEMYEIRFNHGDTKLMKKIDKFIRDNLYLKKLGDR